MSVYNLAQTSTQFAYNALGQNFKQQHFPVNTITPTVETPQHASKLPVINESTSKDEVKATAKTLKSKSSRPLQGVTCFSKPNKVQVIMVTHPDEDIPRVHDEVTIETSGKNDSKLCSIM